MHGGPTRALGPEPEGCRYRQRPRMALFASNSPLVPVGATAPMDITLRPGASSCRHVARRRQKSSPASTHLFPPPAPGTGLWTTGSSFFSRARAPDKRWTMSKLSSWHAYSYICSAGSILVQGILAVQGLVHVEGSSMVNS